MNVIRSVYQALVLLIFISLSACSKDDEDSDMKFDDFGQPSLEVHTSIFTQFDTLSVGNEGLLVEPLDKVSFDILIHAPNGFFSYSIFLSIDGAVADTLTELGTEDLYATHSVTDIKDTRTFEIPSELINTAIKFQFMVLDQENLNGGEEVELTVVSPKARKYQSVQIFPMQVDTSSYSFFSSITGLTYTAEDITDKQTAQVDFGYYYDLTDSASITSPKGFEKTAFQNQVDSWTAKNATVLLSVGVETLSDIERFEDIDLVFEDAVNESGIVTNLKPGSIFGFETVKGKRGLVQVANFVDTEKDDLLSGPNDAMVFNVIVQERTPRQ